MKVLDLIRAISGLVVFISHYFQIFIMPVLGRGWFVNLMINMSSPAVITFFVLSGYLIAFSLNENFKRNNFISASEYLRSRFRRIFPPLVISVIITGLIFLIIKQFNLHGFETYLHPMDKIEPTRLKYEFDFISAIWTLVQTYAFGPGTYLSANGPLWSLSYEIGFYLLILCLSLMITTPFKRITFILSSIVFVSVVISITFYEKWLFVFYACLWMMGLGAFLVEFKFSKALLTLFIATFSIALITSIKTNTFNFSDFLSAIIVMLIINLKDRIEGSNLIENSFSKLITTYAKSTYTLYILHFPIFLLGFSLFHLIFHDGTELKYFILTGGYTIFTLFVIHRFGSIIEEKNSFLQKLI